MLRSPQFRATTPSDCHPKEAHEGGLGTQQSDYPARSLHATEPRRWRTALVQASFILLFVLLSPIYYLNRWDFKRKKKRNPFYTSVLVRLQNRFPLLYELAMLAQNFPAWHRVYDVLPKFSGDVLQVGCGTGLLNKHMRGRPDVRFTNMDANASALRVGARLGRYSNFIHAYIDRRTPLRDRSFDVVLFARSFHHVRNHRKAFDECNRLLRDGGIVIIADPVMLHENRRNLGSAGYMANSSIDGVIWRFTRETLLKHLEECVPPAFEIHSMNCVRQLHVTNYNLFVPQTDMVVALIKGSQQRAGQDHPADSSNQG
jgi:SAM-dependent methyltransferase